MGRNNKNIKIQLNNKIDSLLRIGQRKIKDDRTNPNRAEGIHSIQTADTYRKSINHFADYLKSQGVRNIGDITREHIQGFMLSRSSLSPYTYAKDLSAINKVLDTRYTVRDFGLNYRSYADIRNNRGLADTRSINAENAPKIDFIRACGIRSQSVAVVRPIDAVRDANNQVIGFNVIEKGGRERNCVVLENQRENITNLVNQAIERNGQDNPIFDKPCDKNINPHWYRGEYAQNLYNDLLQAREQERDYYNNMREKFVNQEILERACSRYHNEEIRGYDRDIMAEVSQNLGHNRIDVVLYHYLLK
jgi:hypothetical protein